MSAELALKSAVRNYADVMDDAEELKRQYHWDALMEAFHCLEATKGVTRHPGRWTRDGFEVYLSLGEATVTALLWGGSVGDAGHERAAGQLAEKIEKALEATP